MTREIVLDTETTGLDPHSGTLLTDARGVHVVGAGPARPETHRAPTGDGEVPGSTSARTTALT